METVDITIIGAGVVGLAIAAELSALDKSVFLLEKNDSFGQETSSRNSEVIHAGIYYLPGSLKARLCVEGRQMMYSLCEKNNIGFQKCGKIIVAVNDDELDYIEALYKKGIANGVPLEFLDEKQVAVMEPEVTCINALHSPETGIVDSHQLMDFFLKKAQAAGVDIVYQAEVVGIDKKKAQYVVTVENQGEQIEFLSGIVINAAGLNADKIAALVGAGDDSYQQYYLKGNYFRLSDQYRNKTHRLVYPVPLANSLGIHTVIDLAGGIRLGPDEEEVPEIEYSVNGTKKEAFYESVKKFLPCITLDALYPDMAGIRPQLKRPNKEDFRDFIISHEEAKGFPGLINLVGIESPGLTASPAIAKHVYEIVRNL